MSSCLSLRRLAGAIALSLAMAGGASAADLKFRVATELSAGGDVYLLLERFKQEAEQRGGGAVSIEFFHSGSLGNQRQLQEQLQLGTIEAIGTASDIVEMDPRFGIFDLPFLFADRPHVYRAIDGDLGAQLNAGLVETRKARVLAFGEAGFRQITNNARPISSPEDLKGLKIRTPSNKLRIAAFEALGAAPTPIPYKELYTSLQQKVVDGQENPLNTIKELSLWEVQKHVAITNHVYTPAYLLVSEQWWSGLSDDQRRLLQEAADAARQWQRESLAGNETALAEEFRQKGMEFNQPDLAPFVALTRPVWTEFESTHGRELIDMVEKAR